MSPLNGSMPAIKLLVVTRERAGDQRYGLGKSLQPVLAALRAEGVSWRYLSQADLGPRSQLALRGLQRGLVPWMAKILRGTQTDALVQGLYERINMGRLAAKVARREDYTHVHCHDPFIAWGFLWASRLARRRPPIRVGITQHGFGSYTQSFHEDGIALGHHVMRWLRARERSILAQLDWVIAPTQAALVQLQRDLALPARPAHWHCIPHPLPRLPILERALARQHLGWEAHACVLLAVGRLVALKDFATLIQALAQLARSDVRLVILGEGDATPLLDLAQGLNLRDRVQISVTDEMAHYYAAADIYVSTSLTESFGLANLEAISQGLPTVCTAVGGVPEVLGTGACLIAPGDVATLVYALDTLLSQPVIRHHYQQQGQLRTRQWPTDAHIVQQYLALYRGSPPSPAPVVHAAIAAELVEAQINARPPFCSPAPLPFMPGLRVLIFAPHADDESLGCGGTICLMLAAGMEVCVVWVSDGSAGDPYDYCDGQVVAVRQQEALSAAGILGVKTSVFLGFKDGELRCEPALRQAISQQFEQYQPDWVFAPPPHDAHRDHAVVSHLVRHCCTVHNPAIRLFFYEIWTPLTANYLVDISAVYPRKQAAMAAYALPLRYMNYLEMAQALARYRAMHLADGKGFAEAFAEVRGVEHGHVRYSSAS